MMRNSITYRRWTYVKKRNIKKIHLLLRLALAAIILWLVGILLQGNAVSTFGL